MIRFNLLCNLNHEFDGWFRDNETFDSQLSASEIQCPMCGSTNVHKALMTPLLGKKSNQKTLQKKPDNQKALVKAMREIRRKVEENADYVGDKFAEEARRIHYKESEDRGIYGETSLEEAKSLSEEGIEIQPLPLLPEDQN